MRGYSEAQGHAGGIWVLVEEISPFTVSVLEVFHQAFTISLKCRNTVWVYIAIYSRSPIYAVRENLWSHLNNLKSSIQDPWFLIGDFNEVLLPSEVRGRNFVTIKAMKFSQVLKHCGLFDLGATGNLFTWFQKPEGFGLVSKRLDRALADCNWRNKFPEAYLVNLGRQNSDHSPILLRCYSDIVEKSSRPFRFQAAWVSHEGFAQVVQNAWKMGIRLCRTVYKMLRRMSLLSILKFSVIFSEGKRS